MCGEFWNIIKIPKIRPHIRKDDPGISPSYSYCVRSSAEGGSCSRQCGGQSHAAESGTEGRELLPAGAGSGDPEGVGGRADQVEIAGSPPADNRGPPWGNTGTEMGQGRLHQQSGVYLQ